MKDDQTQRRFDILHFNLAQVAGFLLLALTCGGETFALNPKKAITQYTYDVWTTSDGLPHNQINRIVQTRDGYMWLGTPVGLVRFDGLRFTLFDKANTKGIKGNNIVDLR
ncbi:MAG: two-component regulator propeller domain-containing protein [Pyrinomonadaceae bacterium]